MLKDKQKSLGKLNFMKIVQNQYRQSFDNSPYQYFCEVCDSHVQNDAKHCG